MKFESYVQQQMNSEALISTLGSLVLYGADQNEGFQAGTRLFDMGFFGLRVINGGFKAWKEKNLPIVTGGQ